MPMGDQTGPRGEGPMTGRAAGFCAGFAGPGYVNRGPGYGFRGGWGRGHGGGHGWRNWFNATGLTGWQRARMPLPAVGAAGTPPENVRGKADASFEESQLRQQFGSLQTELAAIQQRLCQLEKAKGTTSNTSNVGHTPV